jgi:hypothetical protein
LDPGAWAAHLEALAGPVLAGSPLDPSADPMPDPASFVASFRDESGHRRGVDRPLLSFMLGLPAGTPPPITPDRLDERLWWALHDSAAGVELLPDVKGPLVGRHAFEAGPIEIVTETELGALHALRHLADRDRGLRDQCIAAAEWHVRTLQPDNGTNHPWAVHVFLELARLGGSIADGARLHAETLTHNAMVATGRPDRFSACLLLDAARFLRRGTEHPG